jgi:DNA topoisomerase-1
VPAGRGDRALTIRDLAAEVGARLGNTPAMARKSYIHPAVIALVERQQKWRAGLKLPREDEWLSRHERALIRLLERSPKAGKLLA